MPCPPQDDYLPWQPAAPEPLHPHQPRRVRLVLRDQRVVDGEVHLTEGTDLAAFLGSRDGGWVNLTNVFWQATGECVPHVVLKVGLVLWAGALEDDTEVVPARAEETRPVEVMLENRITLQAVLLASADDRLTDVLATWGIFIPMRDARMAGADIGFGDIAVNRDAIHLLQDRPAASRPQGTARDGGWPASRRDLDVTTRYFGPSASPGNGFGQITPPGGRTRRP